jgi:hypothetical protein
MIITGTEKEKLLVIIKTKGKSCEYVNCRDCPIGHDLCNQKAQELHMFDKWKAWRYETALEVWFDAGYTEADLVEVLM